MKLITLALLSVATPALANDSLTLTAPPPKTLGIDAVAIVPVGDYAQLATLGVGATARLEIPAGTGFVTGRLGAIFHQMNDNGFADGLSLTLIPAYAGYRLPLSSSGAYLAGELGITIAYTNVDTQFGRMSDSDSEIGLALMAGLRRGAIDLRAGLFAPDIDDAVGLLASAGYDFAAF